MIRGSSEHEFLVLAPIGRDGPLTCGLLERAGMRGRVCDTLTDLCEHYRREGALGFMIAEEALTPAAIAHLTELLASQEPWSDLPILLFVSDEGGLLRGMAPGRLMNALGNLSLLDRPLRPITMVSAANAARRSRERQYTARAALEEQSLAIRRRDQFLAMLGHELRNPLAAISMAAALEDPKHADKMRDVVQRQARHLTRLVDDLLDVARVTSGKIVLQRSPVDVRDAVQRALEAATPVLQSQHAEVHLSAPSEPVVISADRVRLEQVLVNLIGNAAKYSPPGSHVHITVCGEDDEAIISVRDEGVGIAPDVLPHVFDLFTQAESSLDRAKGGLGIGLTLVRTLVALHGGTVEAHSQGLGQGSTFTVRFRRSQSALAEPSVRPSTVYEMAGAQRQVLVVEDNDDSRELLGAMLERQGHRVLYASNGLDGVALALKARPEVLLVDIGLPGLDGYGVARKLRSELGKSVYLVALTGYGQPEDRARALAAGFDVHLTKPVDVALLSRLLSRPARGAAMHELLEVGASSSAQ